MPSAYVLHFAATFMLLGLIWVVQLVVYPQFFRVAPADFPAFHFWHCFRIGLVVVPLLGVEAGTAAWVLWHRQADALMRWSFALIPLVWLATATVYAPLHQRLLRHGYDAALIRRVILANWLRTGLWTLRGVLLLVGGG